MTDNDGIDDAFEHTLRTAMMAAAHTGEAIARLREQQRRNAEAVSRQQADELQARFRSEQAAARAHYDPVRYPDWWDRATVDEVVATYQTAAAWADVDPNAAAAKQHIEQQAKTRYSIDLANPGAAQAAAGQPSARARGEERDAADLLAAAAAADRERAANPDDPAPARQVDDLTHQAEHLYDSAARRHHEAERLAGVADAATVDARISADTSQAQPASNATHTAPSKGGRGHRTRAHVQRQRPQARGR